MITCDECDFADWKRTATGRLHPSKGGRCTRLDKHPLDLRLPASFSWIYGGPPKPQGGGYIERGQPIEKCVFKSVTRKDKP